MRRLRPRLASRFVAVLLVFQLLAGLAVCRELQVDMRHGSDAVTVQGDGAHHESKDAAGHHHNAGGHHHECPESFLTSGLQALPALAGRGLVRAGPPDDSLSAEYDILPPIPIV